MVPEIDRLKPKVVRLEPPTQQNGEGRYILRRPDDTLKKVELLNFDICKSPVSNKPEFVNGVIQYIITVAVNAQKL